MPLEKTEAIILRVVEFSETSCVVTLYTEEFGKISALAKGARRRRGPFEGAIDLLSVCRIVFLRKSGDVLDLLTEARLERRFHSASTDLGRLYAALYVIELVAALTEHAEPQPEMYRIVVDAVRDIDEGQPTAERLLRFELQLLYQLGHLPLLDRCAECDRAVTAADSREGVPFGLQAGGVYCPRCRSGKRGVVILRGETVGWMQAAGTPASGTATASSNSLSRASQGELRGLLDQYLANLLGWRPRTTAGLQQVFGTGAKDG
jgi:DNA repair protein RecO (recombination protein O)